MAEIRFGTKAETLERLRRSISFARVKPSYVFTLARWRAEQSAVLQEIREQFAEQTLFVRSSALHEDSEHSSHAGKFLSVGDVPFDDELALRTAIENVFRSYDREHDGDQCFIQEHIQFIKMSGVLFTRSKDTRAPYYVVNYDESGSYDSVTSGAQGELKTYIRFRGSPNKVPHPDLALLIEAAREIEALFGSDALDIEFAVTRSDELYILQVRPIAGSADSQPLSDEEMERYLLKVFLKIQKLNAPHPGLFGDKSLYSVMSDWNPAEMIGIRPRTLALSLYKELITDTIWAYQRRNYGYRDLRSFPLLITFLGCPYIDVRASFNSFVPASLDSKLAGKLVDYYLERLRDSPTDHDKVEFNILFSCYFLNFSEKVKKLLELGFNELEVDRLKFALLDLTNKIVSTENRAFREDLERVNRLEARQRDILGSELPVIDKLYWLVEDCKRFGTLPFAGLARAGFIAVQFLRSMVEVGIISDEELSRFMGSLNTVARRLSTDTARYAAGELSLEELLERYGHLRPGTYDILSQRYDEAPELYFHKRGQRAEEPPEPFQLSPEQREHLSRHLAENGISVDCDAFMKFLAEAIEGREYGKFVFSKNLSNVLLLVEQLGRRCDISRNDMAFANIRTVMDLYSNLTHHDVKVILEGDIKLNRESHAVAQSVELPQLITSESDVYDFFTTTVEPNYITRGGVTTVIVVEADFPKIDLTGKIALIRSADPGYDWVFARKIAGLITMYGGVNSHMAIRCAELKIPAVIGCGEQNFHRWSRAETLEIDCANKKVVVVR